MADPSGRPQSSGVARRRRERRLRSMLRHERMTVAMALAEFSRYSSRGQRMARAGVWGHEQNYTAKIRKPPTPQPELFSLEEEPGGGLPAPLSEVAGRQDMAVRHVMDDLGSVCPFVQILDLLVPQTVDNVTDALRILDRPMAEQVIDVPKISCSPCPSRSPIPEPQSAEQLVEVPTVLSPTRIALQIAEQIVDTPVPRGRGQGFLPEQSLTAFSSSVDWSRTLTFLLVLALDRGLPHLLVLQKRILLWFFHTFPHGKKCGVSGRSVRTCPGTSAHGPRRLTGSPGGPMRRWRSCSLSRSSSERRRSGPGFESSLAPLPSRGGERGTRGGRGGRLVPPLALFEAALIVDSGSGMFVLLALCSLLMVAGPDAWLSGGRARR